MNIATPNLRMMKNTNRSSDLKCLQPCFCAGATLCAVSVFCSIVLVTFVNVDDRLNVEFCRESLLVLLDSNSISI